MVPEFDLDLNLWKAFSEIADQPHTRHGIAQTNPQPPRCGIACTAQDMGCAFFQFAQIGNNRLKIQAQIRRYERPAPAFEKLHVKRTLQIVNGLTDGRLG